MVNLKSSVVLIALFSLHTLTPQGLTPLPLLLHSAEAQQPNPACDVPQLTVGGMTLPKRTSTTYRYFGFRVFDATLFVDANADLSKDFVGKVPLVLQLCYHRDFSADDFKRSGGETIVKNPEFKPAEMQKHLAMVDKAYLPITAGDFYRIEHSPGKGLEITHNGKSVVRVEDDTFARVYLGIWLSPYSFSESLWNALSART